ncbi:MAG TPA: hypothetical protein VL242_41460 [Sorangium sp.]|nr:hypothetical protein [Sorangium sp.]
MDAEILDQARDRFRFLRVRDEQLQIFLGETDAATLPSEGWLGQAVARLRGEIQGTSELDRSRALCLLHYLHGAVS